MRRYLNSAQVLDRYDISSVTLWRWQNDPAKSFPLPVRIGRKRLWSEDALNAFDDLLMETSSGKRARG